MNDENFDDNDREPTIFGTHDEKIVLRILSDGGWHFASELRPMLDGDLEETIRWINEERGKPELIEVRPTTIGITYRLNLERSVRL